MFDKENVSLPENPEIRSEEVLSIELTESTCVYMARFLNSKQRSEVFDLLLELKRGNPQISPEKQVSKSVHVSITRVYEWKNKTAIPKPENAARILSQLLKLDPERSNPRINAIVENIQCKILNTYVLLLDKKLYDKNPAQLEVIRQTNLQYLPSLVWVLLFDQNIIRPSSYQHHYPGYTLNPEIRSQKNKEDLAPILESANRLRMLLDRVQDKYDRLVT